MTIKGKRDGALRKMKHDEAFGYRLGGAVDESFPADKVHAALRGLTLDLATFDAFLGSRLGLFRERTREKAEQPTVGRELELIHEAMDAIEQTRRRLEYLPRYAEAFINEVCWHRHRQWFHERRIRLDADLAEAWTLLGLTARKLAPFKNAKPKSAGPRDDLLCSVAQWLQEQGAKPTKAAGTAIEVLRAVGIDAPACPKKARGLVHRKGEKLRAS